MPENQPDQADTESLARKLRALEPQLTANERRLLARVLAAAALSGIVVGAVDAAGGTGLLNRAAPMVLEAGTASATERWDDIRAQFRDSFTPGEVWETPPAISIKPPN